MIPKDRFYQVIVKIETEDENTGKLKKYKEVHLVDAKDTNEAVSKVSKEMQGCYMQGGFENWEIVSISISKIDCVYG